MYANHSPWSVYGKYSYSNNLYVVCTCIISVRGLISKLSFKNYKEGMIDGKWDTINIKRRSKACMMRYNIKFNIDVISVSSE